MIYPRLSRSPIGFISGFGYGEFKADAGRDDTVIGLRGSNAALGRPGAFTVASVPDPENSLSNMLDVLSLLCILPAWSKKDWPCPDLISCHG